MRWVRLDVGLFTEEWFFVLSIESQMAYIRLITYCKESGVGGKVAARKTAVLAKLWGMGEESIDKAIQAAVREGQMKASASTWEFTNKTLFQQPDPTNAERQSRHRGKKRVTESNGVTPVTVADSVEPENDETTTVEEPEKTVTESNGVTGVTNGVTCHATKTETKSETETIGGDPPTPLPPENWWDFPDSDPFAVEIVHSVRSAKRYESDCPKEHEVLSLVQLVRDGSPGKPGIAPDMDFVRREIEVWIDVVAGHSERKYQNPIAHLKRWLADKEPEWRKIKRARKADEEIAERGEEFSPSGRKGRRGTMRENLAAMMGEGNV